LELSANRKRILDICYEAPNTLGDLFHASNLGLDIVNLLAQEGPNETLFEIIGLKAV
jgi:hypothetical protein